MKRIIWFCVLLFVLLSLSIPVFATSDAEETFLVTVEDQEELTTIVTYDKAYPRVWLIDPSGNWLEAKEDSTDLEVAINETWAAIRVKNPAKGDWQIAIEKGDNTQVNHYMVTARENIWIQYIHVTPNDNGTVEVKFLAELGEMQQSYDFVLSLGTEDGGSVEVRKGSATTGREKTLTLNLREYNSYEAYVLRLFVETQVDGKTLFDEYDSETFAYQNPNMPKAPNGLDVQVDNQLRQLIIDWSQHKRYSFDSYFLEIYCEGEQEPVYYGEFQSTDDRFSTYIPSGKDQILVRFYGREGKLLSEPVEKRVVLGDKSYLQIVTESPTAANQAQVRMNLPKDIAMTVQVGDTVSEFISDGKENVVAVEIFNGNNTLVAEATVDGVVYRLEKKIYKDGVPPMLSFFEPYDGKWFVDAQVQILGNADDAKKLYLNGQEITLDKTGDFATTVTLQPGENVAEFIAEDAAGNRVVRTICLRSAQGADGTTLTDDDSVWVKQFIPLFAALGVSALAIVLLLIMRKRKDNLKKFSWPALISIPAVLAVLAGAMLTATIIRKAKLEKIVSSMELSYIMEEDVQKAAKLVTELDAAPQKILLWSCIAGGMILATVVLILVKNRSGKRGKKA